MLMRHCGYFPSVNRRTGELSYIRQLRRTPYPRFHIYINSPIRQGLVINLHLDAKRPSYEGSHAHSGEYDSDIVSEEAERINTILQRL